MDNNVIQLLLACSKFPCSNSAETYLSCILEQTFEVGNYKSIPIAAGAGDSYPPTKGEVGTNFVWDGSL